MSIELIIWGCFGVFIFVSAFLAQSEDKQKISPWKALVALVLCGPFVWAFMAIIITILIPISCGLILFEWIKD